MSYPMFGLEVHSDFALPGMTPSAAQAPALPPVALSVVAQPAVDAAFSGETSERRTLRLGGGDTAEVILGSAQDILVTYGDRAVFRIERDGSSVLAAPIAPDALDWQRVLLDTVLGIAGLARGREALHAAAVEMPAGVAALAARTGAGKSTLCAELIGRGGRLFSDDMLFLGRSGGTIIAFPGPPLMNLPLIAEARIGRRLAVFGDEEWVSVPGPRTAAAPLGAIVVIDRDDSVGATTVEPTNGLVVTLAMALDSGPDPDRLRARFELLGDLALQTQVVRLRAHPSTPPAALADAVQSVLEDPYVR
jgi:hypothetical protein